MPNYLKLMRTFKEPKDRHYHWARYDDPRAIQEKKYAGYDFVMGKELKETMPAKKTRFQPGVPYVSEEGLVRIGDMVLMQTTKENWEDRKRERGEKVEARKRGFAEGGHLADTGHVTHARQTIKNAKLPPRDERQKGE